MIRSLANESRPLIFEDIFGQDNAVMICQNMLRHKEAGRHLLFCGTVGSGKTTMARIFARALNCLSPTLSLSPCLKCSACLDEEDSAGSEFDVAGEENQQSLLKKIRLRLGQHSAKRYRCIFLDEAHALEKSSADALLKTVEDAPEDVVFLLATTEPEGIAEALRSRLLPIHVKPLDRVMAVKLLDKITRDNDLDIDSDALRLLAGLGEGYPRNMINMLQVVRDFGQRITRDRVLSTLDLDHEDTLLCYFYALADGDRERQVRILEDWNESLSDKARWIQCFLLKLDYSSIGLAISVDPFVDSISASAYRKITQRFEERLKVSNLTDWRAFWHGLLKIWHSSSYGGDNASLALRFALFHERVNAGINSLAGHQSIQAASILPACDDTENDSVAFLGRAELPVQAKQIRPATVSDNPNILGVEDVRSVVNRASFLIQQYGVAFNAHIRLIPDDSEGLTEAQRYAILEELLHDIETFVCASDSRILAWLAVMKRTTGQFTCEAAVCLPDPLDGLGGPDRDAIRHWIEDWAATRLGPSWRNHIELEISELSKQRANAFHWSKTIGLLESIKSDLLDWDRVAGKWISIRKLLKMSASAPHAGHIGYVPLVRMSKLLTDEGMDNQCANRMTALSAIDARQWKWVRSGWEWQEYHARKRVRNERLKDIEMLKLTTSASNADLTKSISNYLATMPPAQGRERLWTGWWVEAQ